MAIKEFQSAYNNTTEDNLMQGYIQHRIQLHQNAGAQWK